MKIQPQELAISGKTMVSRAIRQYQRLSSSPSPIPRVSMRCGTSSGPVRRSGSSQNRRRVSHSPAAPTPMETTPKPIIQRKPQYSTGMFGR